MWRNRGTLMAKFGSERGFTLLELLAAVTLLVLLGSMLFQMLDQASTVMRIGLRPSRREANSFLRKEY